MENKEKDLEETLEDMDLEQQLALAIKERDEAIADHFMLHVQFKVAESQVERLKADLETEMKRNGDYIAVERVKLIGEIEHLKTALRQIAVMEEVEYEHGGAFRVAEQALSR